MYTWVEALKDIGKKLNDKINKMPNNNTIWAMKNLGQDVKEAMTGGSVAVVGTSSINEVNLHDNLLRKIGNYIGCNLDLLNGFFDTTNDYNNIGISSNYVSIKCPCQVGEKYKCDCAIDTPTLSIVVFYKEDGTRLSDIGKGNVGTYKNYEFTVPEGAYFLTLTTRISLLDKPSLSKLEVNDTNLLKNDITNLNEKIDNNTNSYNQLEIISENGFYETSKIGFNSNSGYWSIYYPCNEAEQYKATFNLEDSVCAKVIFYNSEGTRISWIGKGETGNFEDFMFQIPEGISYFSITSKATKPILKKFGNINDNLNEKIENVSEKISYIDNKCSMYAYKLWDVYYIMWKYNTTKDIIISFNKVGQSKLYQISHFYTIDNTDKNCCGDFTKTMSDFKATSSDFVGPYKVIAKNNIDGDSIDNISFTGGWHGYNGDQTGSATGKNISCTVYVDGKQLGSSNKSQLGGEKIEIIVVNQINASNTKKNDGSGRNVLEETITYTITDGNIKIDAKIKALEDITIKEYYGLQIEASGYKENVMFISDKSQVTDYSKYTYFGVKNEQICNRIVSNGTDRCIVANVDDSIGLGKRKYVSDTSYTAWSSDYGKSYFYLVKDKDLDLNNGEYLYWTGSYEIKNRII